MEIRKNKIKILPQRQAGIAVLIVSFAVFATTLFALAQNQNNNSLFLDSDQDGLTDQEEKMIGTDPFRADTDGDGYSDGKEVASGYNPLKAAPGDKIIVQPQAVSSASSTSDVATNATGNSTIFSQQSATDQAGQGDLPAVADLDLASGNLSSFLTQSDLAGDTALTDVSSDPSNPNLTNEMIGQLMQLTKNKATTDSSFVDNPTYSSSDIAQVTEGALQTVDITKNLPEIKDSDLNILPVIDDKKLSADDTKAKQKAEIETYLAQAAFVLASNSPFPVEDPTKLQSQITSEHENLIAALTTNDSSKLEAYASRAQKGIDQLKKIRVPYLLKDIHKSTIQLALFALNLKDNLSLSSSDPMKSLAAVSNIQSVAQKSMGLQDQFSKILSDYEVDDIKFP